MEVYFATSNDGKYREAKEIIESKVRGVEVKRVVFDYREIRSESLKEIAEDAVLAAYSTIGKLVFVEDAGLFVEYLNGFPGTFSGWVFKKIGIKGMLNLLRDVKEEDRKAEFRSVIAFYDGSEVRSFAGRCPGKIAFEPRGKSGFGYDPIFIPEEGDGSTFAENIKLKNNISHRYKALSKFCEYLNAQVKLSENAENRNK